jgi:hypothetical protein
MEYNEQVNRERLMLRLGGGLAVLGALGYLVSALWHGDLPDQTTEIALEHIADRPEWHLVHLIGIVSVLLWVGAVRTSSPSDDRFCARVPCRYNRRHERAQTSGTRGRDRTRGSNSRYCLPYSANARRPLGLAIRAATMDRVPPSVRHSRPIA